MKIWNEKTNKYISDKLVFLEYNKWNKSDEIPHSNGEEFLEQLKCFKKFNTHLN